MVIVKVPARLGSALQLDVVALDCGGKGYILGIEGKTSRESRKAYFPHVKKKDVV